ncbi:MAG: alkaline phosphatase [Bacteroidales bacterium]|nr:alkaline phosphatase [Bacteroidales bacterium]
MKKRALLIFSFSLMFVCFVKAQQAKNVIILIGDGTGLTQLYSAYEANNRFLNIYTMPHTALSITNCTDRRVTDSGAGGTAIACGEKTYYRAIGVDKDTIPIPSMLEICKQMGKKTGIIVSCDLAHATPGSFIAHVKDREMYEQIAEYYLGGKCDIFLGGGKKRFDNRADKRDLTKELRQLGYEVVYNESELLSSKTDRIAGFFADKHLPLYKERGKIMQTALETTINRFKDNPEGFFIMLEGSQIDMQAHDNHFSEMIDEALDFDACVGIALDFARRDKNTLVVITADHETGGLTLPVAGKDMDTCKWTTTGHTSAPIIIYAEGPGSENFHGVIQNNEQFHIIMKAIKKD